MWVAFKGSDGTLTWGANTRLLTTEVQKEEFRARFPELVRLECSYEKVILCGHSRGGHLACIAYGLIEAAGQSYANYVSQIITFGQPNCDYTQGCVEKLVRVFRRGDPVPALGRSWMYATKLFRPDLWFDGSWNSYRAENSILFNTEFPLGAESQASLIASLAGPAGMAGGYVMDTGTKNHSITNYLIEAENNYKDRNYVIPTYHADDYKDDYVALPE